MTKRATGQHFKSLRENALVQAQPHEEEFVALGLPAQDLLIDESVPVRLNVFEPFFRMTFGRERHPALRRQKPGMGTGPDTGIFAIAPIEQIMAAFRAGTGMI